MKKIRLIIALCLCSVLAVFLTACTGSSLAKPEDFKLDSDTLSLSWDKVSGAKGYTIEINGAQVTTKANYYSLADLEPGIYDVKVKANGDGKEIDDSQWAVYEGFEKVYETGLLYKLINNKTEYELVGVGSAQGDIVMEDVYRGKPVTKIADNALRNNRLSSFTVGKNVKTIGKNAFQNSQNLTELVIPENVVSVGESLVQGSKKLEKVTLPQSVLEVPKAFATNCSALTEFVIGSDVVSIGENAFSYCSNLTTVKLPESVKTIGNNAFFRCESVTSVDLGGAVYVGENAFSQCTMLVNIDFGECLETISGYAFYECDSVEAIALPDTVTTIGGRAFFGMGKLADIQLSENLESIGSYAFHATRLYLDAPDEADTSNGGVVVIDGWVVGCKNANIVTYVDTTVIGVAALSFGGAALLNAVYLPSVEYIGEKAFTQCPLLVSAEFSDSLIKIDANAFSKCEALINVFLGNSLTHIGDYAFYGCKALAGLSIPNTVERIGTYAFNSTEIPADAAGIIYMGNEENPNLWVVGVKDQMINNPTIKDGTKGIANYAFNECFFISDVVLPDSLEYIGRGAFYACGAMSLMSINIPKNLRVIDDYAFYECPGLWLRAADGSFEHGFTNAVNMERIGRSAFYNSLFLGANEIGQTEDGYLTPVPGRLDLSGVDEIGVYAFYNSMGIETLYIGNGVQKIGDRAFANGRMTSVTIAPTVTEMGVRVFQKCLALTTAVVGNGLQAIPDYTFYSCVALNSVTFVEGGGVEHIGKYAFRGCASLQQINFGDNLKSIDNYAFIYCGLKELVLPNTLQSIGNYSFRGCDQLTAVVIPDTLESVGKHAFYGLNKATIYCEAESIPAYWNERWNTSFRTVVWGCTLSEDDQYVVSVNKTAETITNPETLNGVAGPTRAGYIFVGWSTTPEGTQIDYAAENIAQAPDGTLLYAVWTPAA